MDSDEESGSSEEDAGAVSDSGSEFSEAEEAESASESDADSSDVADSEENEDITPAAKRQKKVSSPIPIDTHTAKTPSTCQCLHICAHPACAYALTVSAGWMHHVSICMPSYRGQ